MSNREDEFPEIADLPAEAFNVAPRLSDLELLAAAKIKNNTTEPVYRENGLIVIRNSKFGACPREIWAYGSGIEPSREKSGNADGDGDVFEEGNLHEKAVKDYCREKLGWTIENEEEEFDLRVGSVIIRGHADAGIVYFPGDTRKHCFEIKSFGRDAWEKFQTFGFDAYPGYLVQISVMMIALKLPGIFMGKNRDNGKKTDPIVWDDPPISKVEIMKKAMMIYNAIKTNEMPDCGNARKYFQGWCRFGQLHNDEPIPQGAIIRADLEWVLAKLKTLKKIKANEEERAEMIRIIERELPKEIGGVLIAGGLKAVRSSSVKIDRKKLANDFPEVFQACKIETEAGIKIMGVKDSGLGIDGDDE